MKTILVNAIGRENRIGVLDAGELQTLHIWNHQQRSLVGNIYVGQVEKIVPGMDAAFVRFGPHKNGFLHRADIAKPSTKTEKDISKIITQGEKIMVQVVRDENEHKGARLSGYVEVSTPFMVYTPGQGYVAVSKKLDHHMRERWKDIGEKHQENGEGMLIRTEMAEKDESFFEHELKKCRGKYRQLQSLAAGQKAPGLLFEKNQLIGLIQQEMKKNETGICVVDDFNLYQQLQSLAGEEWELRYHRDPEDLFLAMHAEQQLKRLYKNIVWLDNGGFLVIEEGEAMTTIDVNTGKFTGKKDKSETIQSTNLKAVRLAFSQIRLRNISGMILIDFINGGDRAELLRAVNREAKKDSMTVKIAGFSDLGILELTRKVTSPSLRQQTTEPCPVCQGSGRVESSQSAAFRLERELYQERKKNLSLIEVEVSADVLQWFSGENTVFKDRLQSEMGCELCFTVKDSLYPYFRIRRLS
ncbi:ribonuclease E/G [Bacillus testis]|uniref:ribonuclease E/G n=1 Tax=Bacillus testis TaxID=1622072 RepID=UPI00067EF1EF|nr:ribonuclease E/G [Bacillus testis]